MIETLRRNAAGPQPALKLLADPTRLRILALLESQELSVGELSRALGMSQSRVSNHLRLLREAGLLTERHAGTSTHLRLALLQGASPLSRRLFEVLRAELPDWPEHAADRVRLEEVLALRQSGEEELFDRLAGEWDKFAGAFETGRAREGAAAYLLPDDFVAADLGCGTGYMARALLGRASRLICVDRSRRMLEEAERRLVPLRRDTELEFRRGELDALPIADEELDGLVLGMVLHHLPELAPGIAEMARVLKPGGSFSVLELAPHKQSWMKAELGDVHLGLEPKDVLAACAQAGFDDLLLDPVEDRYRPRRAEETSADTSVSLSLYLVRGRKPSDRTRR